MRVLGVGGCSSGVGKTTLVCRLLEVLPGWGALKTAPGHAGAAHDLPAAPYRLLGAGDGLLRSGKDTARYHEAGAARVAWLTSRPAALDRGMREALDRFSGLPGIVVEGNSFARFVRPDRMILVARAGASEIKPSALALLASSDWVVLNVDAGTAREEEEETSRRLIGDGGGRRIVRLDAASPDDPATVAFLGEVRAWARC